MATYTLLEYQRLTPNGEPMKPANSRTTSLAFGEARQLSKGTLYFEAIPDVDAYMLVSDDGDAATSADEKIYAGVGGDGHVDPNARAYVYIIAA